MSLIMSRVHSALLALTGLVRGSSLRHLQTRQTCLRRTVTGWSQGGHGVITGWSRGAPSAQVLPGRASPSSGLLPDAAGQCGTPDGVIKASAGSLCGNEIASQSLMAIKGERGVQREEINSHPDEFFN